MTRLSIVLVVAWLSACGGVESLPVAGADALAADSSPQGASSIDAGDPAWPACPPAWPPSPRLEYCGTVGQTSCYEIDFPGVIVEADGGTLPSLPCQAPGEVVLLPAGGSCGSCSSLGFGGARQ